MAGLMDVMAKRRQTRIAGRVSGVYVIINYLHCQGLPLENGS